jgi:hypothetical protein
MSTPLQSEKRTNVFVSYSHSDASLVTPIVQLLRANESLVFQDVDRIRPGKKWRDELEKALDDAGMVVVFWCGHASESMEVAREWNAAIAGDKDLLPLLLDATPLPPKLAEYQWIDFRGTVGRSHSLLERSARRPAQQARSLAGPGGWYLALGTAAAGVMAVAVLLTTLRVGGPDPVELPPDGSVGLPAPVADFALSPVVLIAACVVAALSAVLVLRRRARAGSQPASEVADADEIRRSIAGELEAELLRRATAKTQRKGGV